MKELPKLWHNNGDSLKNYKYFINEKCEYFPCHKNIEKENFNCLFCFCPLYPYDCKGNYTILENGWKDCSLCNIPHDKNNYDYIVQMLTHFIQEEVKCKQN